MIKAKLSEQHYLSQCKLNYRLYTDKRTKEPAVRFTLNDKSSGETVKARTFHFPNQTHDNVCELIGEVLEKGVSNSDLWNRDKNIFELAGV